MPSDRVPAVLVATLHDDNIGVVPQLELTPLAKLSKALIRYGWSGFSTRYWQIGDHDTSVAMLARGAWDPALTVDQVVRDLHVSVCGEASLNDMTVVLKEVEAATWLYEWNDVSLAFPVPGMMMKHWESGAMPGHLIEAGDCYKRALEAARRALERSRPAGRGYVERWIGRLEFGIGIWRRSPR